MEQSLESRLYEYNHLADSVLLDTTLPPMKGETQEVWHAIVLAMATVECGLDQSDRNELQPYLENAWSLL